MMGAEKIWRGFLFLVLAALTLSGCELLTVSEEFYETYHVKEGSSLEVENLNGNVDIQGWEEEYMEVEAVKKSRRGASMLEKAAIEVEVGEKIFIETQYSNKTAHVSVNYKIRLPKDVTVARVKNSNGSISLNEVSGDAEAATSNGRVSIFNVDGIVKARSSNGTIEISGVRGLAGTRTSNGSIKAEIPALPDDIEVKTSNGSIDVKIDPGINADITASTSNGSVNYQGLEFSSIRQEETYLEGRIGRGGHQLIMSTSNGSIDLERL